MAEEERLTGEQELMQHLNKLSMEERVELEQRWREEIEKDDELKREAEERAHMYEEMVRQERVQRDRQAFLEWMGKKMGIQIQKQEVPMMSGAMGEGVRSEGRFKEEWQNKRGTMIMH